MAHQYTIPGVLRQPKSGEIRDEVRARMAGFELRQAARDQERKIKNEVSADRRRKKATGR